MNSIRPAAALAALLLLAACGPQSDDSTPAAGAPAAGPAASAAGADAEALAGSGFEADRAPSGDEAASARDAFLANLSALCGQAFAGRVLVDEPAGPGNDAFAGKPLVMHVRECSEAVVKVPFHVGDDRSRTWVLSRTDAGLRLKHDHRHEDGSPDAVTLYGGDTAGPGSATRQEFPVDAESVAMFRAHGLEASVSNTWAMELEPGHQFVYVLARPGGRLF